MTEQEQKKPAGAPIGAREWAPDTYKVVKEAADLSRAHAREAAAATVTTVAKIDTKPPPEGEKPPPEEGKAAPVPFEVVKAAGEQGVIIGVAAATTVDLEDERLTQEQLVKMCHDYTAAVTRKGMANHDEDVKFDLVQSWPAEAIKNAEGKIVDFKGLGAPTHWFVGVRPKDPAVLEAAKAGEIVGFSWSGLTSKRAVKE